MSVKPLDHLEIWTSKWRHSVPSIKIALASSPICFVSYEINFEQFFLNFDQDNRGSVIYEYMHQVY